MWRAAGVTTRMEVTQPSYSQHLERDQRLRMDIVMVGALRTVIVDVTVSHPLAPSALPPRPDGGRRGALANIERAAHVKTEKYRDLARAYGADMLPFACDVYGAMGRDAHRLLRWIFAEAHANGRVATAEESRDFRNATYCAVGRDPARGGVLRTRRHCAVARTARGCCAR